MSKVLPSLLAALLLTAVFSSCHQAKTPKEVSSAFVKNLYTLKFDEAAALTTAATKANLQKGAQELQGKTVSDEERTKRIEEQVDAVFATSNLVEHGSGDRLVVQNEVLTIPLQKEGGEWKVAASEDLVQSVLYRQLYLENVKVAWQRLQDEFEKKNALVQEYANSQSSPTPQTRELAEAAKKLANRKVDNAAQRASYIAETKALNQFLEKNLQPSFTAGSDLSLNYIIQMSTANDRIKEAQNAYNEAALKARSKDFLPISGQ